MKKVLGTIRKFSLTGVMVALVGVALAACGDNTPTTTNTPAPPTVASGGVGKEFKVVLAEWTINPKTLEAPTGKVLLKVSNAGQFPHNLVIQGTDKRTPDFTSADEPKILEIDLPPGSYTWVCDITGHAERGMTGQLVVK